MNPPIGLLTGPGDAIPALSDVVGRLLKLPHDASRRDILSVARADLELADAALRLAGAPYSSGQRAPKTLTRLVERVGLSGTQQLFLRAALEQTLFSSPALQRLHNHSTAAAYTTQVLSRHTLLHSDLAFVCALLQHSGAAVAIQAMQRHAIHDETTWWQIIGCAHEALAGMVAGMWGLPERIQTVLFNHHQRVGPQTDPIIAALQVADLITCQLNIGLDLPAHPPPDSDDITAALQRLELSPDRLSIVIAESEASITQVL